jgi:hypothetical protein
MGDGFIGESSHNLTHLCLVLNAALPSLVVPFSTISTVNFREGSSFSDSAQRDASLILHKPGKAGRLGSTEKRLRVLSSGIGGL